MMSEMLFSFTSFLGFPFKNAGRTINEKDQLVTSRATSAALTGLLAFFRTLNALEVTVLSQEPPKSLSHRQVPIFCHTYTGLQWRLSSEHH